MLSGFDMVEIGRLFWKKVVTSDDFIIGEAESAELDTATWQVTNLYVSLNDDASEKMEFERPYFGKIFVCLPVNVIAKIGDFIVLKSTMQELMELKQCRK
jgi:sporulation protein YlmC with PRC-barrel domain